MCQAPLARQRNTCRATHKHVATNDWVGPFSDNRAAVRVGGLYGFVDDEGREIVKPQYRIVDDYQFGQLVEMPSCETLSLEGPEGEPYVG